MQTKPVQSLVTASSHRATECAASGISPMPSAFTVKCFDVPCLHIDTEEKETNKTFCSVCLKGGGGRRKNFISLFCVAKLPTRAHSKRAELGTEHSKHLKHKTGEWPTPWTQSLVITFPKKGNLQQCQNYQRSASSVTQAKSC